MSDDIPTPEVISTPDIQPIDPPPEAEAVPAKDESAAPKKRATRSKTKSAAVAAPVPEPPPPTPEVPPPVAEKPKPKAKPRAKKQPSAPAVTIEAVDLTADEQHEHPPPEETSKTQRHSEEPIITAATQIDTRTPHQRLMDVQTEMRRLRREAKQVHYKKMLEGKL
jgi:hypothetical protein